MTVKHMIRKLLWSVGYDVSIYKPTHHPHARRKQLVSYYEIETILDIGANTGQFAQQMRNDLGYRNRIISFEPVSAAFTMLEANARGDVNWDVFNFALGDTEERRKINISGNLTSSSLLDMLPAHLESAPQSKYVGKEEIEVKKLDSIFGELCGSTSNVYMKIDAQGFEDKVLRGAKYSLKSIDTVQLEMTLMPLYSGEKLFHEICMLMIEKGYTLVAIENGLANKDSGQLLQIDGIFHRLMPLGID